MTFASSQESPLQPPIHLKQFDQSVNWIELNWIDYIIFVLLALWGTTTTFTTKQKHNGDWKQKTNWNEILKNSVTRKWVELPSLMVCHRHQSLKKNKINEWLRKLFFLSKQQIHDADVGHEDEPPHRPVLIENSIIWSEMYVFLNLNKLTYHKHHWSKKREIL